jgi:hypothetical protein
MVMLWRGAVDERGRLRRELAFGLALVLFVPVYALFDMIRALGFLRSMRSPGHFFDLAPFAFYALFGTGLVAIVATVRGTSARRGLLAAVATLVVLDFWPSMRAFEEGVEPGPVRELEQILTALPGEGGTLRVAMYPWFSPSDWTAPSLALAHAEAGAGWSWLYWQAGPHWARYLRSATLPFVREVDPEKRERFHPVAEVLARIARLKYVLDEKDDPPALVMEAPWKLRAENTAYALWEQPEVMPMASGYRTYVLAFGTADSEVAAYHAAGQNAVVLSGGDRLADTAPSLIDGAALVVVKRGEALAGAASEALARRYGDKIVEIGEWPARLGRLPRAESVAATYRRPAPERVVLETDAGAAPAVVFLSESYHPWWKATVDGAPAPVVRAETALMAVPVGPGRHVIELRLARPVPVVVADWLTTSAWALLPVAAAAYAIDRARRPRLPRAGGEA